ncbi:MAG TPA: DUF1905 domain-containing protein [Mycobacteriales bacterium]|nr:DUF1905 domain-containing protein [Mycobacteriales bacterium]
MGTRFTAELWDYDGQGSWHFVTVPGDLGEELSARVGPRRGFGSVRVEVTVGSTTWRTSVFPSKEAGYVLPIKRSVRLGEQLDVGDAVDVRLAVLD